MSSMAFLVRRMYTVRDSQGLLPAHANAQTIECRFLGLVCRSVKHSQASLAMISPLAKSSSSCPFHEPKLQPQMLLKYAVPCAVLHPEACARSRAETDDLFSRVHEQRSTCSRQHGHPTFLIGDLDLSFPMRLHILFVQSLDKGCSRA